MISVIRILDCWDSLTKFFTIAVFDDKLKSAELVLNDLNNPIIKCYFLFLKYSLNFFNTFNAMFQSRQILIHQLSEKSIGLLKIFCQNFVKSSLVDDNVYVIDFENYDNFLPVNKLTAMSIV